VIFTVKNITIPLVLDLGFDPSDKAYENRLVGLILSARDLNVAARQAKKFCNEALAVFKARQEPKKIQRFANKDINAARDEYSRYFLSELDDEIFKHLPNYEGYIEIWPTILVQG
jgi:hypothetical protein